MAFALALATFLFYEKKKGEGVLYSKYICLKNQMKKIISSLLCLLLILNISSCSQEELGIIEKVDIPSKEIVEKDSDVLNPDVHFSPLKNDLGLNFKIHTNKYMNLSIPYPDYFDYRIVDDHHLELINTKDHTLQGCNIKIFFDTGVIGDRMYDNKMPNATFAIDRFRTILETTKYKLEDKSDWREPELDYSDIETQQSWTNGYEEYLYQVIKDNANLKDVYTGQKPKDEYVSEKYFLIWNNHPVVVIGVAKQEDKPKLTKLLDYMVSNITYPTLEKEHLQKVGFEKDTLRFTLPDDFEIITHNVPGYAKAGVQYIVPINKGSKYANMAFSLYKYDKETWNKIDQDFLEKDFYGYQFFQAICLENSADFNTNFFTYPPEKKKFGNLDSTMFWGWTTVEEKKPEYSSFYDGTLDLCHSINKIKYNDDYYLAVFSYGMNKIDIAHKLIENIY